MSSRTTFRVDSFNQPLHETILLPPSPRNDPPITISAMDSTMFTDTISITQPMESTHMTSVITMTTMMRLTSVLSMPSTTRDH